MYLDLNSIFNVDGEKLEFNYQFSIEDFDFVTPITVCGSVYNKTGIVHLKANAKFDYSTSCAKCNKEMLKHANIDIKHILLDHADTEENDDFIVLDGTRLNLDDLVSEDIYLSIPMRFLCKEDCKGLCSICGVNLNDSTCSCSAPSDPRWDALKSLFNE